MRLRRRRGLGSRSGTGGDEPDREGGAGRGPSGAGGAGSGSSAHGDDGSAGERLLAAVRAARRSLTGRPGRWLQTAVVVLLCFGIGWVVAAGWVFPASEDEGSARLVRAPGVVGLPAAEARERLEAAGLGAELREEVHAGHEAGVVVAQDPLPDQLAPAGTAVALAVSRGAETRRLPDLRGLSARQAVRVLEGLGFRVSTRVVASGSGPGGVQGSRPAAGEEVELPAEVELLVGEGPQVVVVPALRGRHIDDVEGLLNDLGLQLGSVRFEPEAEAAPGRVVGQSPPAGYSVRSGGFVAVEVAGRPGDAAPQPEVPRPGAPGAEPPDSGPARGAPPAPAAESDAPSRGGR